MLFLLFSVIGCSHAASLAAATATPSPIACAPHFSGQNFTLTTSGFSLPLTSYEEGQACTYRFAVPTGYFAYVDLKAFNVKFHEYVYIMDSTGVSVENDETKGGVYNYFNAQSWPIDFEVTIEASKTSPTTIQMSLDIQLLPQTPNANIVKSYVTFAGTSSVFLYNTEWNDGESYKFTSKSGKVYVLGAAVTESRIEDNNNWNNVFIYEGGVFKGTLANAVQEAYRQKPYISTSNEVILYCTKKVVTTGAVMITDYSNVQDVQHNAEYVPQLDTSYDFSLDSRKMETAFTVVSARDKPTKLTLDSIQKVAPGVLSYIAGGPIQNHSNSVKVTENPPQVITGYANTFYLSKGGYDVVWWTV